MRVIVLLCVFCFRAPNSTPCRPELFFGFSGQNGIKLGPLKENTVFPGGVTLLRELPAPVVRIFGLGRQTGIA